MRAPRALTGTAAVLAAVLVTGSTGLSSASALPIPAPTLTAGLPAPLPTLPTDPAPTLPGPTIPPPPGGVPLPPPPGSGPQPPPEDPDGPPGAGKDGSEGFITSTKPMIAGSPGAGDLLDDESTPALQRASKRFLAADQGIADIVGRQQALLRAVASAQRVVDAYDELAARATTSRRLAVTLHDRETATSRQLAEVARSAYRNGGLGILAGNRAITWSAVADQLVLSTSRVEKHLGGLSAEMTELRREYDGYAVDYYRALLALDDYRERLARLAAARSAALTAARAARAGDVAQSRVRQIESGRLGETIRAASKRLRDLGDAVDGSGDFARPGAGELTSRFGPRFHPILRYTKLHTGVDFGRADGTVRAADDGVVLFTVANRAYGNMTIVDHGQVDGRSVTTMYAHQARFLVGEGERVTKGQAIGIIGSTGYSTGPHLHFEVRDAGIIQNPMPWF